MAARGEIRGVLGARKPLGEGVATNEVGAEGETSPFLLIFKSWHGSCCILRVREKHETGIKPMEVTI